MLRDLWNLQIAIGGMTLLTMTAGALEASDTSFTPGADQMILATPIIVHARVDAVEGGGAFDLEGVIHDNGSYIERTASLSVLKTLKGEIKPGARIYAFWCEGGKIPLSRARLQKGGDYLFFLSDDGGGMTDSQGKPQTVYRPVDPIVGILPGDPWIEDLIANEIQSPH